MATFTVMNAMSGTLAESGYSQLLTGEEADFRSQTPRRPYHTQRWHSRQPPLRQSLGAEWGVSLGF